MSGEIVRSLGRCLPPQWRRRVKRELLLRFPSLYAARTIWPRLSPGGCCVFDDYTNEVYRGATQAVDTFVAEQGPGIGDHGPLLRKMYFAFKD